MLIPLQLGSTPAPALRKDAVDMLLECHQRIRAGCALAVRLASTKPSPAQAAEAARSLVSYFGDALPLHVEDEDLSLAPALALRCGVVPQEAVAQMAAEHEMADALLGLLMPRWKALAAAPEDPAPRQRLSADTDRFCALMERHLMLEERAVFPLARKVLLPSDHERLATEIRARRTPKS